MASSKPTFTFVIGPVCVGKTTYIKEKNLKKTSVHIDAGDIYLKLNHGSWLDFGEKHEKELNEIGLSTLTQAFNEKKNITMEILGYDVMEQLKLLLSTLKKMGYHTKVIDLDCDIKAAQERNKNRQENNISAYFTEPYHINWLLDALKL